MVGQRELLKEKYIVNYVVNYLINKEKGNWHIEKSRVIDDRHHGVDINLKGGKTYSEHFLIECKGKSYAKSAASQNKEGWIHALGQIITRMDTKRTIQTGKYKGDINRAYKYGLGLYWQQAQVALKRIPKTIAVILNLYIFSVYENGKVVEFHPSQFGKKYPDSKFVID